MIITRVYHGTLRKTSESCTRLSESSRDRIIIRMRKMIRKWARKRTRIRKRMKTRRRKKKKNVAKLVADPVPILGLHQALDVDLADPVCTLEPRQVFAAGPGQH